MTGGERAYPLPGFPLSEVDDARFTNELVAAVAATLVEHGYPRPASPKDWIELQQALFRFIYAGPAR